MNKHNLFYCGLSSLLAVPRSWIKPLTFTPLFSLVGTLLLINSAQAGVIIAEDFSSGASNFSVEANGTWGANSGRYILTNPVDSGSNGLLGNISVQTTSISGDFELSATVRMTGTSSLWNDVAVIFCYQDTSNYYYVSFNESNDGYTSGVFKVVNGTPTELQDITGAVSTDTDHVVFIERSGSSIAVWLNSNQVASTSDSTFTSGNVGFGTRNDSGEFDDLVVEQPGIIFEDFSSGAANFNVPINGTWSVSGGRYILTNPVDIWVDGLLGNISIHDDVISGDFSLSTTIHLTGTASSWNDVAVLFGYQDTSNYYYVSFNESNDGYTSGVFKVVNGSPTQLQDITTSITTDTDHLVEIERNGSYIVAWLNSVQVASTFDSTFSSGKVGYGARNDGGEFDDLLVISDGSGDTQAPSIPTGLSASNVTDTTVDLDWTASTDDVGVTGYKVYTNGANPIMVSGVSTTVSNLTQVTNYTFTVSAIDAAQNESAQSNGVNIVTLDGEAPTVPTGIVASNITTTTVDLDWSASTDNVAVTGYKVYVDGANPVSVPGTSVTLLGLTPDTSYTLTVSALDAADNESAQSSGVNVTTDEATATYSMQSSVSQYGITWTFNQQYPVGQYANGDYWVLGPVTITSISPASTTASGWTSNGTQVDPAPGGVQGFDSSPKEHSSVGPSWNAALNVHPSFTGNPLALNSGSVVSTISRSRAAGRPQLDTVAILTVVASMPADGSFRPGPSDDGNTDRVAYWNASNLDYSFLHSLTPVSGMPTLSATEAKFERPWVAFMTDNQARYVRGLQNQPEYGREIANTVGDALMVLHMDYTNQQKEALYIRLVQLGIDIHSAAVSGAVWLDLGGINPGHKAPLVLAALALNDPDLAEYADASQHFIFQEDRQTWYVTEADVGRDLYQADGRPREEYTEAHVGLPEWGEQHTKQPVRDGSNWNAAYRSICNGSLITHALAMRITRGGVEAWNWDAFFDYHDRAFPIDAPNAGGTNIMKVWEKDAWNAYRSVGVVPE